MRRRTVDVNTGLAYTVDAVPVRAENGPIEAVLAVARPALSSVRLRRAGRR
jgi:hypothetical protein